MGGGERAGLNATARAGEKKKQGGGCTFRQVRAPTWNLRRMAFGGVREVKPGGEEGYENTRNDAGTEMVGGGEVQSRQEKKGDEYARREGITKFQKENARPSRGRRRCQEEKKIQGRKHRMGNRECVQNLDVAVVGGSTT